MIGMLLIGGLTLWLTGVVICMIDARKQQQGWVLLAAWLPFAASRYYRIRWQQLWPAVIMQVAGLGFLLVAGLMLSKADSVTQRETQFYFEASKSVSNKSISLERAALVETTKATEQTPLKGILSGQHFAATHAELTQGILHIQQGEGFYGERAIDIDLGELAQQLEEGGSLHISDGEQTVEVRMFWKTTAEMEPESLSFTGGYRLSLDLRRASGNTLEGFIRLILPDPSASYVVGSFTAFADQLRYLDDGSLNYAHDSIDTLEFVASEYLVARYGKSAIKELTFSATAYQDSAGIGKTTVSIDFVQGQQETYGLVLSKATGEWVVLDKGKARVVSQAEANTEKADSQIQKNSEPSAVTDVSAEPAIIGPLEFKTLVQFSGKQITAIKQDGQEKLGVMRGIHKKALVLETLVGSGKVEVFVKRDELVAIRLKDGTEIAVFVEGDSQPAEANESMGAPAVETKTPSAAPSEAMPAPQIVTPAAEPQSAIEAAPVVVAEENEPQSVVEQEPNSEPLTGVNYRRD